MQYETVVVGAGPAGSTAAKFLAEKGVKVLLLDKEQFPRYKPCGGGLPLRVLKEFPYVKDTETIKSYSYGGIVHSSSRKYTIEVQKPQPIIAMVSREHFDHALVQLAQDKGADVQQGSEVTKVHVGTDAVTINLRDGSTLTTPVVIGADGCHSIVARTTGLFHRHDWIGTSIVEEFPMSSTVIDELYSDKRSFHLHMKFNDLAGYAWVFPKDCTVNIGLGQYQRRIKGQSMKKNLRQYLDAYLSHLKKEQLFPQELESSHPKGGVLPVAPLNKTYKDRVLLCGDAAGFINPITGEGIYYAIASGSMAAKTVLEASNEEDYSEHMLTQYEKLWRNTFGKDIALFQNSTGQWKKRDEKLMKLMKYDATLTELFFQVFSGQSSIYDLRWKIITRYLYANLRYGHR
jgi:geranylgeranyl reductase family protein